MTSYNREMFIAEAIESVLVQTYHNFELIIVDDCSKDKTVEIASKYITTDNRVKCFVNEKNLGDYPNRNRAASYASGDFIVFCDSDDTLNDNALEYIIQSFNSNSSAQHSSLFYGPLTQPYLMESEEATRTHFFKNNILSCGPGARVFRNEFYKLMGGYPEEYGPANDMFFNIKSTSYAPILLLPYIYLNYRVHEGQEINNAYGYLHNGYRYFNDILKTSFIPLADSEKNYLIVKNKRRFLVNSFKYLFMHLDFIKFLASFKLAKFTIKDFFIAIIH